MIVRCVSQLHFALDDGDPTPGGRISSCNTSDMVVHHSIRPAVRFHRLRLRPSSCDACILHTDRSAMILQGVLMHLLLHWCQTTGHRPCWTTSEFGHQHTRVHHLLHPDPSLFAHDERSRDQLALLEQTRSAALVRNVALDHRIARFQRQGPGTAQEGYVTQGGDSVQVKPDEHFMARGAVRQLPGF